MTIQSFAYTGATQDFVVPGGVTSITVECWGAEGGGHGATFPPGLGGYVKATVVVTPGETIRVYVGAMGAQSAADSFGGGGGGGDTLNIGFQGGGATDIRRTPYALANRLLVAGGGGAPSVSDNLARGGGGAYPTGVVGGSYLGGSAGGGGTASAGGAAGSGLGTLGEAGALGLGGNGYAWNPANNNVASAGGGGGGGLYGGGGGAEAGGGGGGSSAFPGTGVVRITDTSATNVGNGAATIQYTAIVTAIVGYPYGVS